MTPRNATWKYRKNFFLKRRFCSMAAKLGSARTKIFRYSVNQCVKFWLWHFGLWLCPFFYQKTTQRLEKLIFFSGQQRKGFHFTCLNIQCSKFFFATFTSFDDGHLQWVKEGQRWTKNASILHMSCFRKNKNTKIQIWLN